MRRGRPDSGAPLRGGADPLIARRIAVSAVSAGSHVADLAQFRRWFRGVAQRHYVHLERASLDELAQWERDPERGDLRHSSGRFFSIHGLEVHDPGRPVPTWSQPIINQPEVGILGILVKEFDGVLHCLMQAKIEPGNVNGLQISPTVQATRSNYTRVHRGRAVPYLDYFLRPGGHRVLADVRQSEQGSWFLGKRNRNMVVEVAEDVEVLDGFCWLSLGQLHGLLGLEDMVNMDARTVLSCLPFSGGTAASALGDSTDELRAALVRSYTSGAALHPDADILSWITATRTLSGSYHRPIPLRQTRGWRDHGAWISHELGCYFDVIGVHVTAGGREVAQWSQPMIEPRGTGVIAFLVRPFAGVLHVLAQIRTEPGFVDVAELGPTVQCIAGNYAHLPPSARPRFLDEVLRAAPDRIHYDVVLSEEGGRFHHARNRYLIVEAPDGVDATAESAGFRWVTLRQLAGLLPHSHYLNVQARSLVACLHSLASTTAGAWAT